MSSKKKAQTTPAAPRAAANNTTGNMGGGPRLFHTKPSPWQPLRVSSTSAAGQTKQQQQRLSNASSSHNSAQSRGTSGSGSSATTDEPESNHSSLSSIHEPATTSHVTSSSGNRPRQHQRKGSVAALQNALNNSDPNIGLQSHGGNTGSHAIEQRRSSLSHAIAGGGTDAAMGRPRRTSGIVGRRRSSMASTGSQSNNPYIPRGDGGNGQSALAIASAATKTRLLRRRSSGDYSYGSGDESAASGGSDGIPRRAIRRGSRRTSRTGSRADVFSSSNQQSRYQRQLSVEESLDGNDARVTASIPRSRSTDSFDDRGDELARRFEQSLGLHHLPTDGSARANEDEADDDSIDLNDIPSPPPILSGDSEKRSDTNLSSSAPKANSSGSFLRNVIHSEKKKEEQEAIGVLADHDDAFDTATIVSQADTVLASNVNNAPRPAHLRSEEALSLPTQISTGKKKANASRLSKIMGSDPHQFLSGGSPAVVKPTKLKASKSLDLSSTAVARTGSSRHGKRSKSAERRGMRGSRLGLRSKSAERKALKSSGSHGKAGAQAGGHYAHHLWTAAPMKRRGSGNNAAA